MDGSSERPEWTERSIQVELEITPLVPCPVAALDDVSEVHQRVGDDVCRVDALVEGSDSSAHITHLSTEVGPSCSCLVFDAFDCVPQVRSTGESLRIRTYVPDRATLAALVAALRETASMVRLLRISETPKAEHSTERVSVSLDSLTPTQRETLEVAIASGYFATPKEVSLEELAAEFGVSKSAISRRLHAAQTKLVGELFPPG